MNSINNIIRQMLGKPMTKEQRRFLNELREKVKAKKMTVKQAKQEWNKKYKVW